MNIPLSSIVINAKENENQLLTINYFCVWHRLI